MKKRITALFVAAMLLTGLFAFAGTAMAATISSSTYDPSIMWVDDTFTVTSSEPTGNVWVPVGDIIIQSGQNTQTCIARIGPNANGSSGVKLICNNVDSGLVTLTTGPKSTTATFKCVDTNGRTLPAYVGSRNVGPNTTLSPGSYNQIGLTCISVSPPSLKNAGLQVGVPIEITLTFRASGSSNNWNNWYNAPLFPGDPNYNAYPGSGYWYNGVWIPGTNNPYSYPTTPTAPVQQAAPNAKANVGVGGTLQLTSTMLGGVNPYTPGIVFRSSDTRVATITNNGLVTGVGAGVTRITASDGYGRQYGSWDLVVGNKTSSASSNAQAFTLSKTKYTMKRDSEFQLFATSKGQKIQVNWISSNPAIASVDENGWVTTYDRRGKVKITAFISGGSSKVCTLTVK